MKFFLFIIYFILLIALPAPAFAMHIADGILPITWSALWFAAALPFVGLGIYRLRKLGAGRNMKPLIATVAAAVFVVSCTPIPVPVVGSCSHPAGTAMAAVLLGPLFSVLAAAVSLILQALFLSDGGLSALGANVFSMGVAGSFAGYFVFRASSRLGASVPLAAFLAGIAGDWATYGVTAVQLAAAVHAPGGFLHSFYMTVLAFAPVQVPVGIIEGVITAVAVKFLHSRRPDLVEYMIPARAKEVL